MRKLFISIFIFLFVLILIPFNSVFADESIEDTLSYKWVGGSWNNSYTNYRLITNADIININNNFYYLDYFIYTDPDKVSHICWFIDFGTNQTDRNYFLSNYNSNGNSEYLFKFNTVVNGNIGSNISDIKFTENYYQYYVNDTLLTSYYVYCNTSFNRFFYSYLNTYKYFVYNGWSTNINGMICYIQHGYVTKPSNNPNTYFSDISLKRWFPFVFGSSNSSGSQYTHNPDDTINTINPYPYDVWNTYEVNRETPTETTNIDTYILPDAIDINNNVINETDLRYQDVTYNTEYNISNVTNYYGEPNDSGDNGDNGSINNSGVTVTQTIEENAINVIVNNNNNVNNEVTNEINNILNNTNPNGLTFQSAVQTIQGFNELGNSFSSLATSFIGFLPNWASSLMGLAWGLIGFFIVLKIIGLFI